MEFEITQNLIINEMEKVEKNIKRYLQQIEKVDFARIKEFVNSDEDTVLYLDAELKICSLNSKDVKYAWLDSGYGSEEDPVFLSLVKYDEIFEGHYVGTASYLANGIADNYGKNKSKIHKNALCCLKKYIQKSKKHDRNRIKSEKITLENINRVLGAEISNGQNIENRLSVINQPATEKSFEDNEKTLTPVTQRIYDNLLFPNWQSINGLDRYIKIIGTRIEQLIEKDKKEFFVKNNIRSVIVNTGLMDTYGRDYLLLYKYHVKKSTYVADDIISSKQDCIEQGFSTKDMENIKPISFWDSNEEFFDAATLEDFDFTPQTLKHVIEERRERFPEYVQKESPDQVLFRLKQGLERGLKMQMRDSSFVKASYSAKEKSISWLMPFYIENEIKQEPEMVLVIRKVKEFYEIKTVYAYDSDTKDRITAMYLYGNVWSSQKSCDA